MTDGLSIARQNQLRVLGCMLQSESGAAWAAMNVKPAWFLDADYQAAFKAFCQYAATGGQIAAENAPGILAESDIKQPISLLVSDALDCAPMYRKIRAYASVLRGDYNLAVVERLGSEIQQIAVSTKPEDVISEARNTAILMLSDDPADSGVVDQTSLHDAFREDWQKPVARCPWPWYRWTERKGGYAAGEVVIVGGYTGQGKSIIGLQMLEAACKQGKRALLFSLEMPARQLFERLSIMGSGLDADEVENQQIDLALLNERHAEMLGWKYSMVDSVNTIEGMRAAYSMEALQDRKPDVVIIDHLHLLQIQGRDYRLELNRVLGELKRWAVTENVALVLLAQLRRPSGGDMELPMPGLSSLKESSGIEQIADYVVFVHRMPNGQFSYSSDGQVYIAKQRTGRRLPNLDVSLESLRFVERVAVGVRLER